MMMSNALGFKLVKNRQDFDPWKKIRKGLRSIDNLIICIGAIGI